LDSSIKGIRGSKINSVRAWAGGARTLENLFLTFAERKKIARAKNNGSAAGGLPAMLRKAIAGGGRRAGVANRAERGELTFAKFGSNFFVNLDQSRHFKFSRERVCSLAPPEFIPHGDAGAGRASNKTPLNFQNV